MDNTTLEYICKIIANTDNGTTGKVIIDICNRYAIDRVMKVPFNDVSQFRSDCKENRAPNKRSALLENLRCFDIETQKEIILEVTEKSSLSAERKADIVQKMSERYPKKQ